MFRELFQKLTARVCARFNTSDRSKAVLLLFFLVVHVGAFFTLCMCTFAVG